MSQSGQTMLVGVLVTLAGLLLMMRSSRADRPQSVARILLTALVTIAGIGWTLVGILAN